MVSYPFRTDDIFCTFFFVFSNIFLIYRGIISVVLLFFLNTRKSENIHINKNLSCRALIQFFKEPFIDKQDYSF